MSEIFVCEMWGLKIEPLEAGVKTCIRRQMAREMNRPRYEYCATECKRGVELKEQYPAGVTEIKNPKNRPMFPSRRERPKVAKKQENERSAGHKIKAFRPSEDGQSPEVARPQRAVSSPAVGPTFNPETKEGKEVMAKKNTCKRAGCGKCAVLKGECCEHFKETYGMTIAEFKKSAGGGIAPAARQKSAIQEAERTDFIISVDMSKYPQLFKRLNDLAFEEMRSPENELIYLVRKELQKTEEKLDQHH